MQYPNTNNSLFVYNKQGQLNEVPIVFTDNTEFSVKASATPMEDVIIVGLMFQNNMLTNVDNNPLFKNISNIERFILQQSTNTSFIIPTNNYRIAGVPILFEQVASNFDYVSIIKPLATYPHVVSSGRYYLNITYKFPTLPQDDYAIQYFDGVNWLNLASDSSNDPLEPYFTVYCSTSRYLRVTDGSDERATEPFYLDLNAYNNI